MKSNLLLTFLTFFLVAGPVAANVHMAKNSRSIVHNWSIDEKLTDDMKYLFEQSGLDVTKLTSLDPNLHFAVYFSSEVEDKVHKVKTPQMPASFVKQVLGEDESYVDEVKERQVNKKLTSLNEEIYDLSATRSENYKETLFNASVSTKMIFKSFLSEEGSKYRLYKIDNVVKGLFLVTPDDQEGNTTYIIALYRKGQKFKK